MTTKVKLSHRGVRGYAEQNTTGWCVGEWVVYQTTDIFGDRLPGGDKLLDVRLVDLDAAKAIFRGAVEAIPAPADREYVEVDSVPAGIRFDTPRRNQGQIVIVSYGGPAEYRGEHDEGSPYMSCHDQSVGENHTYRLSAKH